MEKRMITPGQLRFLQSAVGRLANDGLLIGPTGENFAGDEREARISWARVWLGISRLESFSDLTFSQAQFLLDICTGTPTKLDRKLHELFAANNIKRPNEWLAAVVNDPKHNKLFWKFQGRKLHELNRYQKWLLADLLNARVGIGIM